MAIVPSFATPSGEANPGEYADGWAPEGWDNDITPRLSDAVAEATFLIERRVGSIGRLSDGDLLTLTQEAERLGRLVDGMRVQLAGEVDDRSRRELGDERLSATRGCRNAVELLERLTLVAAPTINARVRIARKVRAGVTMLGADIPPLFPLVGDALDAGLVGVDTALTITGLLGEVAPRCHPDDLAAAERSLLATATGGAIGGYPGDEDLATAAAPALPGTAEEVRIHARVWALSLDQDGREPAAERALRKRSFTFGQTRDGITPFSGNMMPELAARFARLFDAHDTPRRAVRFTDPGADPRVDPDAAPDADPALVPGFVVAVDTRTRAQRQHDILAVILDSAAHAEDAPTIGGASPTVLITVAAEELASGIGAGHLDAHDAPIPIGVVHQHICTGATQKIMLNNDGRIVALGGPQRIFNAHQRRAITARDGGCIIPGCTIPAGWCEIHHVIPAAHDGPTHTDNGVLLCWWHHRTIDTSGWHIQFFDGVPCVKAPSWIDGFGSWRRATTSPTRLRRALAART